MDIRTDGAVFHASPALPGLDPESGPGSGGGDNSASDGASAPPMPSRTGELIALLHLASPALPIGGFSYSQGQEAAIDAGWVHDGASAGDWILSGLSSVLVQCELPFIAQQWRRWRAFDPANADGIAVANQWFLASRESAELRQETEQMGWSLTSLAASLEWGGAAERAHLAVLKPVALPTVFAFAAMALGANPESCCAAYAFNWVENQVAAALKAVPLGQLAGQRILWQSRSAIATAAARAQCLADDDTSSLSTFSPLLGILSARHESQYSRLFRS